MALTFTRCLMPVGDGRLDMGWVLVFDGQLLAVIPPEEVTAAVIASALSQSHLTTATSTPTAAATTSADPYSHPATPAVSDAATSANHYYQTSVFLHQDTPLDLSQPKTLRRTHLWYLVSNNVINTNNILMHNRYRLVV